MVFIRARKEYKNKKKRRRRLKLKNLFEEFLQIFYFDQ